MKIRPDVGDEERPQALRIVDFLLFEGTWSNSVNDFVNFLLLGEEIRNLAGVQQIIDAF